LATESTADRASQTISTTAKRRTRIAQFLPCLTP
jgi:hypothetical protein